ncbi:MAG: helix-turn-helix transcriptional regulator [Betaproteobacteria bacterium]
MKRAAAVFEPMGLVAAETAQRLGIGISTFYSIRKDPSFPKAREIAPGVVRYVRDEVDAWLANRPIARLQEEPERLKTRRYRSGELVTANRSSAR